MDDNTYTLVSTALLGVIALLLIFVIARLARVERAIRSRPGEQSPTEAPSVDGAVAAALAEPVQTSPQPQLSTDGGEAPFEKDGRWWYRQGDELLVYNEQTESWVLPDTPSPREEPASEIEPHPLDEARGWDALPPDSTTPEEATAAPIAEPVAPPESITGIDTGVADEPVAETAEAPAGMGAHWKCPACGVINGSTATSCRMCFAARP